MEQLRIRYAVELDSLEHYVKNLRTLCDKAQFASKLDSVGAARNSDATDVFGFAEDGDPLLAQEERHFLVQEKIDGFIAQLFDTFLLF